MKLLPIYPSVPTGAALAHVKEAKAQIPNAPLVQPVRAVPGSPGRILAIGSPPPFLCDYALVIDPNMDSLRQALEWVLYLREDDRAMTVLKRLKRIFGDGVEEIRHGQ